MTLAMLPRSDVIDYGLLVFSAILYGSTFMMIAVAVDTIPPASVVAGRQAIAAFMFIGIALCLRQSIPALSKANAKIWGLIFCSALFGNSLPFFLTTWGQERVDAGLAAIIIATMPLLTFVLAHYLSMDEKLSVRKIFGLIIGFSGVLLLFGPVKLLSLGEESIRQYAILGAASSFAVNMIVMKYLTQLPRYALLAAILSLSLIIVSPFSYWEQPWLLMPSFSSILSVIGIGVLVSAIGSVLSFKILERRGALFNAQTNYIIPVAAIFWAWLILGEIPDPTVYLALLLILLGIAVVRGLPIRNMWKGSVV